MIAPTRTLESLRPGEAMPSASRTFTAADLMAYGAATWDWHRLHYDLPYAQSLGLPNVVLDGQSFGAVIARHALDWLGPKAFITRLSFRMRSMVFAGDAVTAEGEVTKVEGDTVQLAQRLKVGDRIAADGVTTVRLPKT